MPYSFSVLPDYYEAMGEEGPYTAVAFRVECRALSGRTWVHFKAFPSAEEADALAERIETSLPAGWTPENDYWVPGRLVYGSEAYEAGGEHELARADVESEFGPGSYHSGHPGYLG